MQVLADRGQRHVHDRRVEDDHEIAQAQDDEGPPALLVFEIGHG
jgi:hypothetical protein